ncbi:MAG: hypothetical protein LBK52_05025, partial [Deltaproteobacteria bacterium]|nr:hypothetical protein [Deltaproteobacteria bacterium]
PGPLSLRPAGFRPGPLSLRPAAAARLLAALIIFLGLLFLAPLPARADPLVSPFGKYFLSYEQVRPGLWHFILTEGRPGSPGLKPPGTIMLQPQEEWAAGGPVPISRVEVLLPPSEKAAFENSQRPRTLVPVINIYQESLEGEPAPAGREEVPIWSVSAYSPDGLLSGLMISGEKFSHLTGLGADFKIFSVQGQNLAGQVIQPGGPYGNRANTQSEGQTSGLQAPILYALGDNKLSGALFFNETRPLVWDLSAKPWTVSLLGPKDPLNSLDFFVIIGADLPSLRRTFMSIAGRPPVPPRNIFSAWVIDSTRPLPGTWEDYLIRSAESFRPLNIAGILLRNQPDPVPLAEAKKAGLDLMVIESPYLPQNSPHFPHMSSQGFLVRDTANTGGSLILRYNNQNSGLLDYTNPAMASYWSSAYRTPLLQAGASSFLLLGGEPEAYSTRAWYLGAGRPGEHSHYAWANRFALKWMEGIWASILTAWRRPDATVSRLFLLSRAGLAGMSRFGAGLYSVEPFLFSPTPLGQARSNLHLSGIDYFSTDVDPLLGRFRMESYSLAYAAWLSKNALLNMPLLIPRAFLDQPWTETNLRIKNTLEPYFYSLAHRASQTGDPILAPLFYYFQEDLLAREASFEVMAGPNVLIAAGAAPAAEMLTFHLPQGRWYDYHSGEIITKETAGPQTRPCKFRGQPVSPILLREGAIIPANLEQAGTSDQIRFILFPGQEPSSFDYYEDNGVNYNYLTKKEMLKIRLELTPLPGGRGLSLKIRTQLRNIPDTPVPSKQFLFEFAGLDNYGNTTLNGESIGRSPSENDLASSDLGWFSAGTGRLVYKTNFLDLTMDHELVIR